MNPMAQGSAYIYGSRDSGDWRENDACRICSAKHFFSGRWAVTGNLPRIQKTTRVRPNAVSKVPECLVQVFIDCGRLVRLALYDLQ